MQDYQKIMDNIIDKIKDNKERPKLLLHACCAPCSSYVLEYLSKYFDITIYYYNPNIEPLREYQKRVVELSKLIDRMPLNSKVNLVVQEYNNKEFKDAIKGYENLKEGSERCFRCYRLRMEKAVKYAKDNNYDYFTTTLSISPYKNAYKLNEIGKELEEKYNINYLYADFKKKNGYKRSIELSKTYNLYRQDYCGCIYSKYEAMERKKNNKGKNKLVNVCKMVLLLLLVIVGVIALNKNKVRELIRKPYNDIISENLIEIDKKDINEFNITKISEYYFYGKNFNLKGTLLSSLKVDEVNLLFIGNLFNYKYKLNYTINEQKINYYLSNSLNEGINLDDMNIDKYDMYIELISDDRSYYYSIFNNTKYLETTYYTITNNDFSKKLYFFDESKSMKLNITKNTEQAYDVIIDPGHGGKDEGACYNGLCEINYTLKLSELLKEELEKKGYKVALTRDKEKFLDKYGKNGRIALSYLSKAKLLLSIHLNSTSYPFNGFELYTSNNINLDFARNLVNNLDKVSGLSYSNKTSFKVEPGIYMRTFSTSDLNDIYIDTKKNYNNISTNTNYYYMIRETGGYMTGAYVDGASGNGENPYRSNNVGLESYILELGYINNPNNTEFINKYKEAYMSSIANSINIYLK